MLYSEPGPLSSQSLSEAYVHVFVHPPSPPDGEGGVPPPPPPPRGPQSTQSVPSAHMLNSEPGPLSSQSPSEA